MSAILAPMLAGGGSAAAVVTSIGALLSKLFKGVAVQAVLDGTKDIRSDISTVKEDVAFLKGQQSARSGQAA